MTGTATKTEKRLIGTLKRCSLFVRLEDYASLKQMLEAYVNKDSKILILGCGNAGNNKNH